MFDLSIEGASGPSRLFSGPLSRVAEDVDLTRCVLVCDERVAALHGPALSACPRVVVPRGEAAKTLASYETLLGRLLDLGLDRDGSLLAVGGGAVSDLVGFAASTWLRGVDFAFVPTTLLAMVDASVGGKNGLNLLGRKNLIGTFRQPRLVRFDMGLLDTLDDTEFASGMAEAIKHALISGEADLAFLEGLSGLGARPGPVELEALVERSLRLKAAIVGRDEREAGERRVLNLGHTIGHAVEAATGLSHGASVAAGLASICRLSAARGLLRPADLDRVLTLLAAWRLPVSLESAARASGRCADGPPFRDAVAEALRADKKRSGGEILVALPRAPGRVEILPLPLGVLERFVKEAP